MRSVRMRVLATLLVRAAVGAVGRQLLPSEGEEGGTITVGTTDAVTSLDPAGAHDAGSWALFSNVFQSLLTFEAGGASPVPDAADSCAWSDSGLRVYRCELREGLTFPSGRTMTAEDVKYSFDRVRAIKSDVGPASLLDTLDSVDADGLTVTFRLSSPDATFPFKVATGAGSIVDRTKYPKNGLRTDNGVDGSGPYELSSYRGGRAGGPGAQRGRYEGAVEETGRPVELRYFEDAGRLDRAWKGRRIDVATHVYKRQPASCRRTRWPNSTPATRTSGCPRRTAPRSTTCTSTPVPAPRCTMCGCGRRWPGWSTGRSSPRPCTRGRWIRCTP